MAQDWDPYLQKCSSLPPDHGTSDPEMNHPHLAAGFIGHDGFTMANIPLGASATNTNYCFSNSVGNVDSNLCPEVGNFQTNSKEKELQPDEQKIYFNRWENTMQNHETRTPATTGHCSTAPQLRTQQDSVVPSCTPFLNNFPNVQGSSDAGREPISSFEYMTDTSGYTYSNTIWPDLTAENSTKCVQDRCKSFPCDGISVANSNVCPDSEIQRVGSFENTCKQEEFVSICHEANVSEKYNGVEGQTLNDKEKREGDQDYNFDLAHMTFDEKPNPPSTQACNPNNENANTSSSGSLDKSVTDSCQNKEEGLSETLSQAKTTINVMHSDFRFIDSRETSNAVESKFDVGVHNDNIKETVDGSLSSLSVFKSPGATCNASCPESFIQPDIDPHLHFSTQTSNAEQAMSLKKGSSTDSIANVGGSCEQTHKDNKSDDCVVDSTHNTGCIDRKSNEIDCLRSPPLKAIELVEAFTAENASATDNIEDRSCSVNNRDDDKPLVVFDSEQTFVVDNLNGMVEKETCTDLKVTCGGQPDDKQSKNGQSESPKIDPIGQKTLQSSPDKKMKSITLENTSMSMNLICQTESQLSDQLKFECDVEGNISRMGFETLTGQTIEEVEPSTLLVCQKQSNSDGYLMYADGEPLSPPPSEENEMAGLDFCKLEESFPKMKHSSKMFKLLQPVVLIKTMDILDVTTDKYVCSQCLCIASNLGELIEHHNCHHSIQSFQLCTSCGIYLVQQDQLTKHVCGQVSSSKNLQKRGKRKGHHCDKCGLSFPKWNPFISHMRLHTGTTPFKCEKCGLYFAQGSSLRRHRSVSKRCGTLQPDDKKQAPKSSTATARSMFDCYVKLHDIRKTNICEFCGKCFKSKLKAKKHHYNVHKKLGPIKQREKSSKIEVELCSDNKYKCPLCKQIFNSHLNRNRHLKICVKDCIFGKKYKANGRFKCPLCLATFSLSSNRYRHIQTFCLRNFLLFLGRDTMKQSRYSNEMAIVIKKLQAEEKQLNGKTTATVHKAERKPKYSCNLCPAVFFHQSGKYRHMKKHKLYELTGQRFRYRNSLKKHDLTKRPTTDTKEQLQKAHIPLKPGDKPYNCSQCGKGFKSNIHLMHHKITHQRRIQCTVCKRILPTIGELIEHRKSHLNRGLLQCPDCPQKFTYPVYLLRHLHRHHKNQKEVLQEKSIREIVLSSTTLGKAQHSCPVCNEVFNDAELFSKHYLTHAARKCADCPFCKRKFTAKRYLQRHMARHVNGKRFFCKCGKRFAKEDNFKKHSETCSSLKESLVCSYCSRSFEHKMHLRKHQIGHQNKTLIQCQACHFYFGGSKFNKHQRMCKGNTITNNGISLKTDQPSVRKIPSKETQYKCPYCPKTFRYRSLYRRHLSTHKNDELHACILCGQNFHSQLLCSKHEASCEGFYKCEDLSNKKAENLPQRDTSELKCKFCNKNFTKSRHLRRHILSHNEVKPYRCKVCDSCFSRYDHLKVHAGCCKGKVKLQLRPQICIPKISLDLVGTGWQKELVHSNERGQKWECKMCGKFFATQSKLNWHNSMYHSVKRFKCMRCSSLFSHEKTLRNHMKFRKCRLASIVKRNSIPETQIANVSSEKHHKILARIQPISSDQNIAKMLNCNFCPRTFRTSAHLQVHMYLHTGKKSFGCDCGKTFLRKHHLQRHIETCLRKRNQTPSSGFSCAYCSSRFLLFSQLQEHFLNAHKLETMDEPLETAPLQQHLSNIQTFEEKTSQSSKPNSPIDGQPSKLKQSPFTCSICNKGFWNKTLLRNHFRKCRKQVSNTNHLEEEDVPLRADIEMVLSDSPAEHSPEQLEDLEPQSKSSVEKKTVVYQCSECDQSFTDGLMLISHLEDHGREEQEKRLNKCYQCGKMFSSHARLEKHMRLHESGLFVCTDCSTELPSKTELDLHKKQFHDPSHSYSCRLCKYRFKTRVLLCDHCTKEHPNDIFSCTFCERNYTLRASLVRHMNRSHGQEQKDGAEKSLSAQGTSESDFDYVDHHDDDDDDHHANLKLTHDHDDSDSRDSDSAPYFPCHVCGKTFTTSESLEDHQRCHLGEKPFECSECGQCFFLAAQLQQHERKHNSEFQCRVCGRGFVTLFALRKHKHTSGKKRPYPCKKCQLYFTSLTQLAEHKLSHQKESFPCDICNRVFPSKSSRAEHRKFHLPKPSLGLSDQTAIVTKSKPTPLTMSHTNEFKYRCGVCCVRFRNPEELSEHGCLAGTERQYSCMDCDKHFLHSSHLKKHLSTHKQSSLSKYLCNHCNNSFSSPQDFLNHLRNHDETLRYDQQGFVCPVCHQCFASPAELLFHFPTHPSEAFECKICNKSFLTASELREHEVCHAKDTKCNKCGHSIVGGNHDCSRNNLESSYGDDDEIDVTGEDLCSCPFCPMQFSSKSHLLEHQNKQHSKEKSFTYKIGARKYAKQKYPDKRLKNHHQNETGQSTSHIKFKCAQCDCEFNMAKDLSLHLKLHAAEKDVGEFRCDMCYKSFSQLSLLRHHQESHVGEVVYECTECDKAFAFPHLLEAHQQNHV